MTRYALIALAALSGVAGGFVGERLARLGERPPEQVIRARTFELVNARQQPIS